MGSPIQSLLFQAREKLTPISQTPLLDTQVLLAHLMEQPRAWILAHPEAELSPQQVDRFNQCLSRLETGEPLPYVIGHWEFYGLDFNITPDVLIPRPETELLVERALRWLGDNPGRRFAIDVGSGSGCIAVSLAYHTPDLQVVASDLSLPAVREAGGNARRYQLSERVYCLQADLLNSFPMTSPPVFDLICANLPYIPLETVLKLPIARFEPLIALQGGEDGLVLMRGLLSQVPGRVALGGLILLEIEISQGESVPSLARGFFPHAEVRLHHDLAGHPRLVEIQI